MIDVTDYVETLEPYGGKEFSLENATDGQLKVMAAVKEAIQNEDREFIWWMGGVRSGKSFGAAMAFLEHCRYRENAQYIILAYTAGQASKIYGEYFRVIGEAMGMTVNVSKSLSDPKIEVWPDGRKHKRGMSGGNVFLLRGADKEGRDRSIQGLTVDGLLADEIPLLNRSTLHQAEARVSKPGGLRIYTSNKQSEYHWTAKYYLKRIEKQEINGKIIDSKISENHHIDADYISERANEYDGQTLQRFINNEFTLDFTSIYNMAISMVKEFSEYGEYIISMFGHHAGYEVLGTRILLANEKKIKYNGEPRVTLVDSDSFRPSEDVVEALKEDELKPKYILLNSEQPLLARKLRAAGFTVKGYKSGWKNEYSEILSSACLKGWMQIQHTEEGLLEAVRTYSKPGIYEFPIMQAVEALALPLRTLVRGNL